MNKLRRNLQEQAQDTIETHEKPDVWAEIDKNNLIVGTLH